MTKKIDPWDDRCTLCKKVIKETDDSFSHKISQEMRMDYHNCCIFEALTYAYVYGKKQANVFREKELRRMKEMPNKDNND